MATYKLYKSTLQSLTYVFGGEGIKGKYAYFVAGRYATDDPREIAELDQVIKDKNPHIYFDPNEAEVSSNKPDPLHELRKKFFSEFEAERAIQRQCRSINDLDDFH